MPAFGDKDAATTVSGTSPEVVTRVVDSTPVQGTLGIAAEKGAVTFGLNYSLGVGSKDRTNNALTANVRYAF